RRKQGFKTPATTKFGGLQLVAGLNPPLIVPSAFCHLPSAFFNISASVFACRVCDASEKI
ncbi:MAG: hypothetical protein VKN72_09860, partial [Nostocales cyanobacterium 94392]|nr:hypothetical protein [Nostocales cyanobacterium 94392]